MTREEAKAWFKVLLKDEYAFNSADREAFAMAIKALEQEPCENAISREDALMALTGEWTEITDEIIHRFIKRIKALPPVNPQSKQKVGEWILQPSNKEQGERDFIWWKCSECGQVIYSETEKDRREFHAFCNRCGARMVEPQETETWNGIHAQLTAPKGTFERIFNDADDDNEI